MRERNWIWAGALGLALALSACTVEEGGQRFDAGPGGQGGAGGGGEVIDDVCYDGCLKLDECGQCAGEGDCLSPEACAEVCRRTEDQAAYLCLATTNGCNENDIAACLDGSAVDECQAACGRLDACDSCITDDSGTCLDVYACEASCREGAVEGAACLAGLDTCDAEAIEACLTDDGAGDDACADACRVLDGCGQCLLGEDGECLEITGCAEACRGEWPDEGACLNDLMMCDDDAIAACLESNIGDDACAQRCTFLDDCGYCVPDENDECLAPADCAEGCRAAEPTLYACLDELEMCDEAPILACLDDEGPVEPMPGESACERACTALDGCELCWPDDEGECMTLEMCVESCGAGDPDPATAGCLANLASCEEADVDACFGELPVTDCTTACTALEVCEASPEGGTMACIMACEAEWTPGDLACYAAAGETCEAVAMCPGAAEPPVEPTACDLACAGLNGCGLLPPSDDALATCVTACGGEGEIEAWDDMQIGCILEAAEDCEAMQACQMEEPEPEPAPGCPALCTRKAECEMPEDAEAFTAECLTACGELAASQRACELAAPECADLAACAGDEPPSACPAVCERRLGCEAEAPEDEAAWRMACEATCSAEMPSIQVCVLAAAECVDVAACVPAEEP